MVTANFQRNMVPDPPTPPNPTQPKYLQKALFKGFPNMPPNPPLLRELLLLFFVPSIPRKVRQSMGARHAPPTAALDCQPTAPLIDSICSRCTVEVLRELLFTFRTAPTGQWGRGTAFTPPAADVCGATRWGRAWDTGGSPDRPQVTPPVHYARQMWALQPLKAETSSCYERGRGSLPMPLGGGGDPDLPFNRRPLHSPRLTPALPWLLRAHRCTPHPPFSHERGGSHHHPPTSAASVTAKAPPATAAVTGFLTASVLLLQTPCRPSNCPAGPFVADWTEGR